MAADVIIGAHCTKMLFIFTVAPFRPNSVEGRNISPGNSHIVEEGRLAYGGLCWAEAAEGPALDHLACARRIIES